MINRNEFQSTTFDYVPIGYCFLLGSFESKHPLRTFKKVSKKFAVCDEFKNSTYYFHPEEKVHIAIKELMAEPELELISTN